jgi:hypothetical protein
MISDMSTWSGRNRNFKFAALLYGVHILYISAIKNLESWIPQMIVIVVEWQMEKKTWRYRYADLFYRGTT